MGNGDEKFSELTGKLAVIWNRDAPLYGSHDGAELLVLYWLIPSSVSRCVLVSVRRSAIPLVVVSLVSEAAFRAVK